MAVVAVAVARSDVLSHGYRFFFSFVLLNNYLHLDYENHDNSESPPHHIRARWRGDDDGRWTRQGRQGEFYTNVF